MNTFLDFNRVYSKDIEQLIEQEFSRTLGHCYLDHVGSALYTENQIQNTFAELSNNVFANPHARNTSSKCTEDAIDIARHLILQHFNTNSEEYTVIFTSGATQSLRIIAEHFIYGNENGVLAYLQNNHTSALGMRSYANRCVEIKDEDAFKTLLNNRTEQDLNYESDCSNCLFVYPAQSNFCGTKYPFEWIEAVKNGALNKTTKCSSKNWFVVLDCATYVGTNNLDLSLYKPDFVPISFYKMFGFPTGLGALIVKNSAEGLLRTKYLGGGTVLMALSSENVMIPRKNLYERFEAGTLPFLSILAIKHGFEAFEKLNLNFDLISSHTFSLAQYVYRNLLLMHHSNGQPLAKLYHQTTFDSAKHQGGIVNFNLLRPTGEYIGFSEVLNFANLYGIHLRTGCLCNPGACQKYLQLTVEDVRKHFDAGHVCGDQHDLVNGYPTGAVRVSFGYASSVEHADKFLNMIRNCFITEPIILKFPVIWEHMQNYYEQNFNTITSKNDVPKTCDTSQTEITNNIVNIPKVVIDMKNNKGTLKRIFLFPIKSCGAFSVDDKWELTSTGLKYDRQWMIINSSGVCVTQKQVKKMCMIKPVLDLRKGILILNFKGMKSIEIPLVNTYTKEQDASLCQSKVCGDRIQGWDCGEKVARWLCEALNLSGLRLLQQCSDTDDIKGRTIKNDDHKLSLVNKAQYLMVNYASIDWLRNKIPKEDFNEDIDSTIHRFRPNFVVDFEKPFQETEYSEYLFDDVKFKSGGKCTRCQMICIDQLTGDISKEPLASLSREFQGKISFGVYLNQENVNENTYINIGSRVSGITSTFD